MGKGKGPGENRVGAVMIKDGRYGKNKVDVENKHCYDHPGTWWEDRWKFTNSSKKCRRRYAGWPLAWA